MATLSADKKREYDLGVSREYDDINAVASDIIYEGAACTMAAGGDDIGPLNTSNVFVGFAVRRCDNASGAAGDKRVRVATRGCIRDLPVTGATANTAPGTAVYATDDDTFTTTASGALQIGKVRRGTGTGTADVLFESAGVRSV